MVGMRAIRLHRFGPPTNLLLDELPDLTPAASQVRIAVEASGVHLLDTSLRRGEPGPLPPPELPTVPGREVAGVVDLVGTDVDDSWVGRRVVAHLGLVPGGYAEQAVATVGSLFPVPDHVPFPEAVAAVGTGRTAQGLLELEPPAADDVVLVPSAAGGLGWLLVQAARASGATVVAAAGGPARVAALAPLGADLVVDYADPGWAEVVRTGTGGVTVVYDGVGGDVGRRALELLRPGGRQVMFGFSAGEPTWFDTGDVVSRGITVGWSLGPRMQALPGGIPGLAARALDRVAAGEWRPLVTTYPLAEAADAHADLEGRRALGKVVLLTDRGRRAVAGARDPS
jgi:NADPH2:quinone reductase